MMYTSVHHWMTKEFIEKKLKEFKRKYKSKLIIGLGTTAIGMTGNEPIISAKQLQRDLRICKELGIREIVVFRLGGLNQKYVEVLRKFS